MLSIPFPYSIPKDDIKSFYVSFLIRQYIIKGEEGITAKITKRMFYTALKNAGYEKARITTTWKYASAGEFFNYVSNDFVILRGKENVQGEKGFITRIDFEIQGFYKFAQFVSETYAQRPVTQKKEWYFKKKKNKAYNREMERRQLETKIGRGQRKIAEQSGCCLKTVNNRLKKSQRVKTIKRYSESYGMRVRKTNLYFNLDNKVYIHYNKNNTKKRSRTALNLDHSSLVDTALFLNGSKGLSNAYDTIYKFVPELGITL